VDASNRVFGGFNRMKAVNSKAFMVFRRTFLHQPSGSKWCGKTKSEEQEC